MNKVILILNIFLISASNFAQSNDFISNNTVTTNETNVFLSQYYEGSDATNATTPQTESPAFTLLRITLITAILGFLTWVVIKFFFKQNTVSLSMGGKTIEILATVPAGLGNFFVIAKLGTLYYLLSLSNDGLRMLDKITDQEAIDFIELHKEDTLPQEVKFVDLLEKLPEGKPKKALEFLRNKINNLKKK